MAHTPARDRVGWCADLIDAAHPPSPSDPGRCGNPGCAGASMPCPARRATAHARREAARGWPQRHTALVDLACWRHP